jgi:selenoprotein W-related protein
LRAAGPGIDGTQLIWSRKAEGRFPELKDVKQRLRDVIAPDKPLGHSDHKDPAS